MLTIPITTSKLRVSKKSRNSLSIRLRREIKLDNLKNQDGDRRWKNKEHELTKVSNT